MGLLARLQVLVAVIISVGTVGLLYSTIGQRLIALGETGGQHEGFLSGMVENIDTVIPLVLVVILLAMVAWFLVSVVQEEKSVNRPPR